MATRKKILLPRSDIPGRAPTLNEIDFGEIAINTHDGKAFLKRNRDGEVTVESIGSEAVDNVYYVSKSGDYGNDGRSLMNSFKTVDSAVARVTTLQGFKFNETICERDLHLIMDAVRYDMLLDTNFNAVTAGTSYKRGNAIKVTTEQKYQTRRSINEERVGMISAPLVAANSVATDRLVKGFTEIIDIFYDGDPDDLYFNNPPVESQTDANSAASIIQANKSSIQDAVLTYINNAYLAPYDSIKCSRDVGLIIDAIADDLILGTDYNTTTAGWAYKRANSAYVLSDQREITVAAINYAINLVTALAGVSSDTLINTLVDNITDVIDQTQNTYPTISYPTTAGATYQTADRIDATTNIQANKQAIVDDVTVWIDANYPALVYDVASCERDVGYILDALSHDVKYGGNGGSRTNAEAYFVGTVSQLGEDEITATVASYNQLKTIINTYVTTVPEQTIIAGLIDIITEVVTDGNLTGLDAKVSIDVTGLSNTERAAILASKASIQDDTIDYVDAQWAVKQTNILSYDAGVCSRDVGLILDAVRKDLTLQTDYWTITAGNSYLRANSAYVLSDQNTATVSAVNYARDVIKNLAAITSDTTIDTLFKRVTDCIDGTVTTPITTYTKTDTTTYSQANNRSVQWATVNSNRASLIGALTTFITTTYPSLTYDQAKCERDAGFLIDAINIDILYGGNTASRQAAFAYFSGTTSQLGAGEATATIAAFNNLATDLKVLLDEDARVDTLTALVTGVIDAGNTNSLLTNEEEPTTAGVSSLVEYNAILNETDDVKQKVVAYVDENFAQKASLPEYNQVTCYRDVGLILDAVRRDLILTTDYNTITAAYAYLRANSAYVLSDQKAYTIAGIEFARDEVKALAGVTADATIDILFGRITDVLNGYTTTYTIPTYPTLANGNYQQDLSGERIEFTTLIQQQRTTIVDQLITFIDTNYTTTNFNTTKCRRDIGYIIDALAHDVKYSGNSATRQNAKAYFVGLAASLIEFPGQEAATAAAYLELKNIISTLVTTGMDNQVAIDTTVSGLIDIIVDVVNANTIEGLPVELDISTDGLVATQFDAIKAATLQIQDDTVLHVNDFYFNPAYDQAKCARDAGLIIDAIALEYITRSTTSSSLVALSYRRPQAQEVYGKQRAATLAAINYLETLLSGLVDNAGGNEVYLVDGFQRIRDGLNAGPYTSGVDRSWILPNTVNYNGNTGGVDDTGSTVNTMAAQTGLNTFTNTIAANVLDYVNNTLGVTSFDNQTCGEDVAMILNALAYDVDTGTNWGIRQVTEAYFSGVVNQLGNDSTEVSATILAYEYLKTLITNDLPGYATLGAQEASIIAYINAEIDILIDAIKANSLANMPALVYPSTSGESAIDIIGFDTCINNRSILQNNVIDFVNDNNPVNAFDDEKCARDTGLIIDAIVQDLDNDTNFNSVTAGLAYQRGNADKVQSEQLKYTVQSINFLRDLLMAEVSTAGKATITARIKEITELLTQSTDFGKTDGDPLIFSTTSSTQDQINAFNALRVNRRSLEQSVTNYIFNTYEGFEYDLEKCERDVGYIIDGICHDLLYGDQFAAQTIAQSYWIEKDLNIEGNANNVENLDGVADLYVNQLGQNEIAVTLDAYAKLAEFIKLKIPQTTTELNRITALMQIVIDSIGADDNTSIPAVVPTSTNADALAVEAAKAVSITETVLYANKVFPAYTYDQSKCRRDVGFILDALTYDIKYGGNSATSIAMRAYFSIFGNGYGDLLGDNEYTMTIAAYRHLKRQILPLYLGSLNADIQTNYYNLLDIILQGIIQTNAGTFQVGNFFEDPNLRTQIYQYNYPTGLATGYDVQTFPNLIALGYKVAFNALYNIHTDFDLNSSQRLTIIRSSSAVARNQGTDSTIFVKSGDYIINNPIKLPPKTSIIGDALRSVTMRPKNVDSDFFWADNGVYIKEVTFRDHQDGAAVLAYNPNVDSPRAGPFITQSPYVQNCTSLTSSGTGLRIDGSKVSGLRSMVMDAFTQFNAGGIGVHLLNRGYAQLVSLFTVSTTTSVLTETGGQCSLTNSNSSFGEFGLVSRGGSPELYKGELYANYITNDDTIRVNTIITNDSADYTLNLGDFKKPNYNDALKFDSENYYYTVTDVSDEITQDWFQTGNDEQSQQFATNSQTTGGLFGWSVHMSGNDTYSIISEPKDGAGRAEIYTQELVGGVPTWSYQALLQQTPPFGSVSDSDMFGDKVLITTDGSFAAVSAPGKKQVDATVVPDQIQNGQIYLFERSGLNWSQHSTLQLPGITDRSINFGIDFDLSEDGTTVAATTKNDLNGDQGKVYIFQRPVGSSIWAQIDFLFCPDGPNANVNQAVCTLNEDGSDLVVHWKGFVNKMYYYQRNIDSKYILAQVIQPKSNFGGERQGNVRMNPSSTHMIFGDRKSPRGYFENFYTDSDQAAAKQLRKKQDLQNITFTGATNTISTTDVDADFTKVFPENTRVRVAGSSLNDGLYNITSRSANTLTFAETFASNTTESEVQVYLDSVGVAEYFVFFEGQWVTEDIVEARTQEPEGFGFGASVDINTSAKLGIAGNNPAFNSIPHNVTVAERKRSDWQRVSTLVPQTPSNIGLQGKNDNFGFGGNAVTTGGTGDLLLIGAPERRQTDATPSTEYGSSFFYYSILPATGSFDITVSPPLNSNKKIKQKIGFHQRSLITASGHTFEYVGSGTNMFTAIPQNGGIPKKENEIVFDSAEAITPNFGLVYFTATDELGDFRIGENLRINREEGTITGDTFDRSLFAVLTPFILALEG